MEGLVSELKSGMRGLHSTALLKVSSVLHWLCFLDACACPGCTYADCYSAVPLQRCTAMSLRTPRVCMARRLRKNMLSAFWVCLQPLKRRAQPAVPCRACVRAW